MNKKLALFYKVTQKEVIAPPQKDIERKNDWLKEIQKRIPSDWEHQLIRVEYEMFNPEVSNMCRFFNGTCVLYYAIQNMEMIDGIPGNETLKQYREEMLDEMLGYDYTTVTKVLRKRKSTSNFKSTQAWNNFLKEVEEVLFKPNGYEFPNSKMFWELEEEHGKEEAKHIVVTGLQTRLKAKLLDNARE